MTQSGHSRSPICRLLKLLLILLLGVGSASFQVDGASIGSRNISLPQANIDFDFHKIVEKLKPENMDGMTTQIRKHVLNNACNRRFVLIERQGRKGVNARGIKREDLNAQLLFESTHRGTVKIFGIHTGLYLCFNKRGKLITRHSGNSPLCEFVEEYSDPSRFHYRMAGRKDNPWYLGFKRRNGKPYKGRARENFSSNSKKQDCFKFYKLSPEDVFDSPKCDGKNNNGPDVNFCHDTLTKLFKNKKNEKTKARATPHEKRHKKRRKEG